MTYYFGTRFGYLEEFVKQVDLENLLIWYRKDQKELSESHGGIRRGSRQITPAGARLNDLVLCCVRDYLWENAVGNLEVFVQEMEVRKNEKFNKYDFSCKIVVSKYEKSSYNPKIYDHPGVVFKVDKRNVEVPFHWRYHYAKGNEVLPLNIIAGLREELELFFFELDAEVSNKFRKSIVNVII